MVGVSETSWRKAVLSPSRNGALTLATEPPRFNEVLRLIAQLEGILARKSDSEPDVKTTWQGLQRLMDVATATQSMREEHG